jgi:hypothetical protein
MRKTDKLTVGMTVMPRRSSVLHNSFEATARENGHSIRRDYCDGMRAIQLTVVFSDQDIGMRQDLL